jgi:long-subunit acyl-CoA synthetase (AMP-forming)
MTEEWRANFEEAMRLGEIEDARQEAQRAIEKAKAPKVPPRWLYPEETRQAAQEWVDGRNSVTAAREALRESGIHASMKTAYFVPDTLTEPLYSAVLALMVERGEWPAEPGTDVPKWKRTPTISYSFKLESTPSSAANAHQTYMRK